MSHHFTDETNAPDPEPGWNWPLLASVAIGLAFWAWVFWVVLP